jgi:acyl carrier protein
MNVNTPAETLPQSLASDQGSFERQIAALIVSCLHLEITADEIEPDAPLFGEGLGLDSIDALELALAISRGYGLELKSDDEHNQAIFASLHSLARHVELHRTL